MEYVQSITSRCAQAVSQQVIIPDLVYSILLFAASEQQMKLVCKESPKEYLQPFKDKLEDFFQNGRRLSQLHIRTLKSLLDSTPSEAIIAI